MTAEIDSQREAKIKEAEQYERIDEIKAMPTRERVAIHMKNSGYIQQNFWAYENEQQVLWQNGELDQEPNETKTEIKREN